MQRVVNPRQGQRVLDEIHVQTVNRYHAVVRNRLMLRPGDIAFI